MPPTFCPPGAGASSALLTGDRLLVPDSKFLAPGTCLSNANQASGAHTGTEAPGGTIPHPPSRRAGGGGKRIGTPKGPSLPKLFKLASPTLARMCRSHATTLPWDTIKALGRASPPSMPAPNSLCLLVLPHLAISGGPCLLVLGMCVLTVFLPEGPFWVCPPHRS